VAKRTGAADTPDLACKETLKCITVTNLQAPSSQTHIEAAYKAACAVGQADTVQFLGSMLSGPGGRHDDEALVSACAGGHVAAVQECLKLHLATPAALQCAFEKATASKHVWLEVAALLLKVAPPGEQFQLCVLRGYVQGGTLASVRCAVSVPQNVLAALVCTFS